MVDDIVGVKRSVVELGGDGGMMKVEGEICGEVFERVVKRMVKIIMVVKEGGCERKRGGGGLVVEEGMRGLGRGVLE